MTRQEFLVRVRQMSDTLNATVDYPDEFVLDLASMVHADEWRKILGVAPYWRTAERVVTLDANRQFLWSALSTGSGNTEQRVHRVLELTDDTGRSFSYAQPDRVRLANNAASRSAMTLLWTKNGDRVQVFGSDAGTPLHVLVNWTPTPVGELASDADPVDWPNEWKPVLVYETAAQVLSRAGREMNEAKDMMLMADLARQKMLATFAREAAQPFVLGADDTPWEWGG